MVWLRSSRETLSIYSISIEQTELRDNGRVNLLLMFLPEACCNWYSSSAILNPAMSPNRINMLRYFAYRKALSFRILTPPVIYLMLQKNGRASASSFHLIYSTSRHASTFSLKIS